MTSITDTNISDRFTSAMDEIHNQHLKTYGEIMDTAAELCQSHRHFLKSALDSSSKKFKDDEMMFETIQTFNKDLQQKSVLVKEKQQAVLGMMSEIQQKEIQKDAIIQKIEKLKEEQAKRKEIIQFQHKANKDRLKNLHKARLVFQDHLGMEIRTVLSKSQVAKGEKVQFVFRNINLAHPDSAYVITVGIRDDGSYQIVSSDPVLECLADLEKQLQETNNLPVFLANIRKQFISRAR